MNTNKIRNKTYDSILELCEDVVDTYESLNRFPSDEDTSDISFIAKYDEAKEIISYLCKLEYDIAFCQLADPEYDGYIDEYIITIYDGEIWCEPLKEEDNDMHGFTASRNDDNGFTTLSFYSTEKLDSDERRDLLEIFGL